MPSFAQFAPPRPSLRFLPVYRRNLLVWRKLAIASALDLDLLARQRSFQQFQVDLRAALHGQP